MQGGMDLLMIELVPCCFFSFLLLSVVSVVKNIIQTAIICYNLLYDICLYFSFVSDDKSLKSLIFFFLDFLGRLRRMGVDSGQTE